jgi:hypothetical protein
VAPAAVGAKHLGVFRSSDREQAHHLKLASESAAARAADRVRRSVRMVEGTAARVEASRAALTRHEARR